MDFLVKSQGSQVGTNYQGKSENLGMRQIIHGLFSFSSFCCTNATLAMTKIVLTTEAISRTAQYSEMIPKEFISPTPAGTKNNPMFWVRTVERRFTFSGFTFLNARAKTIAPSQLRYPV